MVILHDATKTIQNGVFVLSKKNNKNLFLLKKTGLNKQVDWILKKTGFSQPWLLSFNPFLQFSLDRTIWNKSRHYQFVWVCAPHLEYSIGPWLWRSWELLAFEYVKISLD